jgi:hypothetical protein
MAKSDDFREHIKTGNITEALALALSQATELKITTWVSTGTSEAEIADAKPGNRLQTRINMIAGDIENEIGDQFLGNAPYREIRQFHLEQVALGNQIIKSNLQSLQKLFEVLIALRYPDATTSDIEPQLTGRESWRLPPREDVKNPEVFIEPDQSVIEEPVITPNPLIGENITVVPLPATQAPDSVVTTPTDSRDALQDLTDEDEDDWDESVLDLLESIPSEPPNTSEVLNIDDTDWRDLIADAPANNPPVSKLQDELAWGSLSREDFESPPTSPKASIEEQLGKLVAEDRDTDSTASNLAAAQDLGILPPVDIDSPPTSAKPDLETSNLLDEDWGDMIEDDLESSTNKSDSMLDSFNLEEDEDWDDWVIEESDSAEEETITDTNTFNLLDDDDWDEFEEEADPFAPTPTPSKSASELELDTDWDDLETPDKKPSSSFIEIDTNIGANFEDYELLEDLTDDEFPLYPNDQPKLSENTKIDSSGEISSTENLNDEKQAPELSNQSTASLSNETETKKTQLNPQITNEQGRESREENLFSDNPSASLEESERVFLSQDSEDPALSQSDWDTNQNSPERRVPPPPPPPGRFPNQNN